MKVLEFELFLLAIWISLFRFNATATQPLPVSPDKGRGLLDYFKLLTDHQAWNGFTTGSKEDLPEQVHNWPSEEISLGQISGVAVDLDNNPVIFHRGPNTWSPATFDFQNRYRHRAKGPIDEDTLVTLDSRTGSRLESHGRGLFYMPHGLHIDHHGNTWVTDVALHQVFKFSKGSTEPSLVLGEAFEPGTDLTHFCKPTDVAVASSGVFFVADGYCNNRILKFAPNGTLLEIFRGDFNVPHSLTLVEESDTLCVASREGHKVVCIRAGLSGDVSSFGIRVAETGSGDIGRVFAITSRGNKVYGVTGPAFARRTEGFTFDISSSTVSSRWNTDPKLSNPHDIAVSQDGTALYVVEIGPNRIIKMAL